MFHLFVGSIVVGIVAAIAVVLLLSLMTMKNLFSIVQINIFSKTKPLVGVLLSSLSRNHLCFFLHLFYCCRYIVSESAVVVVVCCF